MATKIINGEEEAHNGWGRRRAEEYDDVKEQLDNLWHAINEDKPLKESQFYLRNKDVKDRHKKPKKEDGSDLDEFVWPELTVPVLPAVPKVKGPHGAQGEARDPSEPTPEPHPEYYEHGPE